MGAGTDVGCRVVKKATDMLVLWSRGVEVINLGVDATPKKSDGYSACCTVTDWCYVQNYSVKSGSST